MDLFDLVAKLTLDSSSYESDLAGAETKTTSFASKLKGGLATAGKAVTGAIVGTTTAVAGLGTALTASAMKTAEYGDSIDKSSQKLGVSASFYQEWEAVLQHSGTSMDAMGATFKTLSKAVQNGSKDQQEAFAKIGLSMDELSNMSAEDVFAETVSALQQMEEGTERTALATQLLGRGAMEMGALLNTSAEDTQAMIDQVHNLGGVMSDDAVKASAKFQDSLQDLKTGFSSMGTSIMSEILPNLSSLMDFIITQLPSIKETVGKLLEGVIDAVSKAFKWVEEHFEDISNVISTALDVISTVFYATWDAVKGIFEAVGDAIAEVTGDADSASVDWKKIAKDVGNAIKKAGEVISEIITAVGKVIGALVTEAKTDGTAINTVFKNIKTVISTSLEAVKGILNVIIALLKGDWKGAFDSAKQVVATVFNGIKTIIQNDLNLAKSIITNVLDAIKKKFTDIFDKVKSVVSNAIGAIKNMFNFSWSLPPLKLPHFKINGSFSLNPPSVPTIGIDWYAKAMNKATVLDGATIFGSAGGNLLGGGEAGREVISGESHLMDMIQASVEGAFASKLDNISVMLARYLPAVGQQKIVLDTGALVGQTVGAFDQALGKRYNQQARYV